MAEEKDKIYERTASGMDPLGIEPTTDLVPVQSPNLGVHRSTDWATGTRLATTSTKIDIFFVKFKKKPVFPEYYSRNLFYSQGSEREAILNQLRRRLGLSLLRPGQKAPPPNPKNNAKVRWHGGKTETIKAKPTTTKKPTTTWGDGFCRRTYPNWTYA